MTTFDLSSVGMGTYLGQPDDKDDYDTYVALTYLIKTGSLNVIDTAINYRCQKSERIVGAALRSLLASDEHLGATSDVKLTRDMVFVATKTGYVPDDADAGIPGSTLIETLISENVITKEDVAGGIHCMHP